MTIAVSGTCASIPGRSANARALRHFIELRGNRHAEVEIRKLAVAVLRLVQKEAPNLFGDYELAPLPDGTFEAMT